MITKTLSGISILDEPHGGIFSNRSFLVTGAKYAGKTVMGLQFIRQGLEQNERCLYLSTMVADDLGILAESLGFDLTPHLASEALTLLEYESFMSGNGAPGLDMLPPEGFEQLKNIINSNSIERVVLDTVLPWVSVRQPERMAEQVFSFTRSFDRLGVTTMLTLPKPVSSLAYRLKKSIEDIVPISILLQPAKNGEPALMQVVKYLGEKKLEGKRPFVIQDGLGIRELTPEEMQDQKTRQEEHPALNVSRGSESARPGLISEEPEPSSIRIQQTHRPRFSTISFEHTRESGPAASPRREPPGGKTRARISDKFTAGPPSSLNTEDPVFADTDRSSGGNSQDASSQEMHPETSPRDQPDPDPGSGTARLSSIWKPQPDCGSSSRSMT